MIDIFNFLGGMLGAIALTSSQSAFSPLFEKISQKLYSQYPIKTLNPQDLALSLLRKNISSSYYERELEKIGINTENAEILLNSLAQFLSPFDYVSLFRRGKINESTCDTYLEKIGFTEEQIENLKKASEFIPGANDMIRFAVREVYSSSKRSELQLDDDFPDRFAEETEKIGMDLATAKDFWAAHWEIPSLQQAFEMLHRKQIDERDIDLILAVQDVLPRFRASLKAIAYQPITRVDVRRLFKENVITYEEMISRYEDLGYNEKDSNLMADWTKKDVATEERELTFSLVNDAFINGQITESEYEEYLKEIGYSDTDAILLTTRAEYKILQEDLKRQVNMIKSDVKMNKISKEQANLELLKLGQPAAFTETIQKEIEVIENDKPTLPTKAELNKMLVQGIIDDVYYIKMMKLRGYTNDVIDLYIQSLVIDLQENEE